MRNTIIELLKKTEELDVNVWPARDEEQKPCLGIRGMPDMIQAGGECWLIYGHLYHSVLDTEIKDLEQAESTDNSLLCLQLGAQAAVAGIIVQLDLGVRTIKTKTVVESNDVDRHLQLHCVK